MQLSCVAIPISVQIIYLQLGYFESVSCMCGSVISQRNWQKEFKNVLCLFLFWNSPTLFVSCGFPYQETGDFLLTPAPPCNGHTPRLQATDTGSLLIQLPSSEYSFLTSVCLLLFSLQCLWVLPFCSVSRFYGCLLQGHFPVRSYSIITKSEITLSYVLNSRILSLEIKTLSPGPCRNLFNQLIC